jgi:cAMP-specific phosphodiesterase 4
MGRKKEEARAASDTTPERSSRRRKGEESKMGDADPFELEKGDTKDSKKKDKTAVESPGWWQDIKDSLPSMRRKAFQTMDSPAMQLFLVTLLLLSLFITDAWTLGNPPDASNSSLDGVLTAVLVIFTMEVCTLSLVEPGYYGSFFFFMDVLGTLSIILDIGYLANSFLPSGTQASGSILRATRTAKLGARYGRLMRLLKILKFVKYCPCVTNSQGEGEPTASSLRKVTNQLAGIISQRVAAMVMIIVIVVPFLSYQAEDYSTSAWLKNIKTYAKNETSTWQVADMALRMQRFYTTKDILLAELTVESPYADSAVAMAWETRETLRETNKIAFTKTYRENIGDTATYDIKAIMDYTIINQYDAACGICLVMLVIVILMSFSASFQKEVEVLVVAPLEKMMNTLRSSATVMLKSMNVIEKDKGEGQEEDEEDDGEVETLLLEKMVEKLTRIIKLTYPGANDLEVDANVDSATASWLNQSYSTGGKTGGMSEFHAIIDDDDYLVTDSDSDFGDDRDDPHYEMELQRLEKLGEDYAGNIDNIDVLERWEFDVLMHTSSDLFHIFRYLYEKLNIFEDFHIPDPIFSAWWEAVDKNYLPNPYHNFHHGCDVAYTVYRLIKDSRVFIVLSQLEVFALMTASLAHDIGHPGVNNGYLIASKHKFALTHNDRSPLENMHCAVIYEILTQSKTNIFLSLDQIQWVEARKIILTCILGTDMAHHFEQISKTQLFCEVNKTDVHDFCSGEKDDIEVLKEPKDRLFIMELCLHCADVSNPYKPVNICQRWAEVVVNEFASQGDREKLEGLEVSPMMDRATVNVNNMQLGFIEFVVSPLITSFVNIFYPLNEICQNLIVNYCEWAKKRREEIFSDNNIQDKEDECRKLEERVKKFRDKFNWLEDMRKWPVRNQRKSTKMPSKMPSKTSPAQGPAGRGKRMSVAHLNFTVSPRTKKRLGKD